MSHQVVAFLLFPKVTQLDLTGPAQVLSQLGDVTIHLVASSLNPVATDAGFSILPTATFADVLHADIICVPGGAGVDDAMLDEPTLDWLRNVSQTAKWISSVCTGSLLLGAAGLLIGKRATSHWASRDLLERFGAIPHDQRVVFDGNVVTGGGVTAGVDFALALTAAIRGDDHAKLVQLSLEYDPDPPFKSGSPHTASPETMERFRVLSMPYRAHREARIREAAAGKFGH